MEKRLWSFLTVCLMAFGVAFAQKTVSGFVFDVETGEPVIGASVKVKNDATIGAATDVNGKFTINNVPNNAKMLVVSYIGMLEQEVAIKPNVKVYMEPSEKQVDEVFVVAYGTSTRKQFTGSATVVGAEDIEKHTTTNVVNTLAGSVPGLQIRGASGAPGAGNGSINIRGIASMYADTEPLIIVDGAPYSASITNINPDDVESVTVIKDAASAALYGARAAGGVIIITTKSGNKHGAQIKVDMKWGANSRAIQDYETIDNPGQYYEAAYKQYYNYAYYRQGMSSAGANAWANNTMLNHLGYNVYDTKGESLIGLNGKLNPNATLGNTIEANGETYYLTPDDWRKAAYHTAFRQEYNVSANGATDNSDYYTSIGYLDEDGILDKSGFKRFTARMKVNYKLRDWLKVGTNVGYVNSTTEANPGLSGSELGQTNVNYFVSQIAPIYPLYVRVLDANGKPVIRRDEHGNKQYDYGVSGYSYPVQRAFLAPGNPLGANNYNDTYTKGQQLNATGTVDIQLTSWLRFNSTNTINWGHSNYSNYETMLYLPKSSVNGQITKSQSDNFRQTYDQTFNFNKTFGLHNVAAVVGHEWYHQKTTYLEAAGQGLFSEDVLEIAGAANNQYFSNSYTTAYNVEGFFGNVLYNYDETYFGSVAFRRDGSSRFAENNRWGNFWSVSGGWLINKEKWFNASWVDFLKLKASIGQKGNDGIGNWNYVTLYSLSPSSPTTMSPTFYRKGNPDITWETTTALNVGVDFAFFKNRLSGTVEFYNNKTSDLLFWLSIPESSGTRGYYGNLGDKRSTGVEISLLGTIVRTKNIDWSVNFNISHNKEKILKLPATKTKEYGGFAETGNNIQMWYEEGSSLFNAFLASYAGVNEKGEALYWYDEDLSPLGGKVATNNTSQPGKKHSGTTTNIGEASRYAHGSMLPKAFGGFGTTLKVYDFDLSLTFDYQMGGKVYDSRYASLMGNWVDAGDAGQAIHKDVLKAWTPNNTSSNIPRYQYADSYTTASSDRWLTSAAYLNFQSFTVGYTLPAQLVRPLGIAKLRVYASGENLCFWSARKGLDPRYTFEGNETLNTYSPVRTIMGGIQISF